MTGARSTPLYLTKFMTMEMTEAFEQAVAASKTLSSKPSNDILLQLYSLYKQATEGDAEGDGPSNPFDFVAKAKHNAWAGLAGTSKEEAMNKYITLVDKLKAED